MGPYSPFLLVEGAVDAETAGVVVVKGEEAVPDAVEKTEEVVPDAVEKIEEALFPGKLNENMPWNGMGWDGWADGQ